jgi:hypothetical protein
MHFRILFTIAFFSFCYYWEREEAFVDEVEVYCWALSALTRQFRWASVK